MERGMTADQVLAALWRRKALIGVLAGAVFALGAAVVVGLPSVYTASVVVRVEPQRPAEEMVQRTVSEPIEQRLLTVRQELLARPVLEKAIQEMGLYPDTVSKRGLGAAVERMRKDLDVKVEGDTAFELSYSAGDPERAAQVANRLPVLFAEETMRIRHQQAARATGLFQGEMDALKKNLAGWERSIAQFKVEHMGELPEQLETNMRALERLGGMLQTKSEELRAAEGRRSDLFRSHFAMDSEAGRLQAAYDQTNRQLVAARTQWTEDHPELQRMSREAEGLAAKLKDAEGRMVVERQERARAVTLVKQIQSELDDLHQQAQAYQKRLDNTPRWAHELGVLQRDYEIARTKYQSVVSRKVEAEIAQELEDKGAEQMFNVISPAAAPAGSSRPDRFSGLLVTALLALGLGVLVGLVRDMRDDSLRDPSEVRDRLPLPVLAVVPPITGKPAARRVLAPAGTGRNQVTTETIN
ncbi:MAG TPA: Wzz/FepE/Etk N-terminal domain-containing protein [Myxococcales bacterium]|jgi:polysaccharide chain length determinant protein (PEP-CTERM system associated)|nr:Wzz/FepE/Etk N-terminal domain-containing protein [Myxococcales bacterium]